jgi:hypothetical protein
MSGWTVWAAAGAASPSNADPRTNFLFLHRMERILLSVS